MQDFLSSISTKAKFLIGGITILIILVFTILFISFYSGNNDSIIINQNENETNEIEESTSLFRMSEQNKRITVHIIGEINTPGVYTLNDN